LFSSHGTFLKVLLGFEVGFSFSTVLSDWIIDVFSTGESIFKLCLFGWSDVFHGDSFVEDWASLDAQEFGSRVGVPGILEEISVWSTHQAFVLGFTFMTSLLTFTAST
jgi:hypothetical protein